MYSETIKNNEKVIDEIFEALAELIRKEFEKKEEESDDGDI